MFWKKKPAEAGTPQQPHAEKLPGPKDIPELAGRTLVVDHKKDPEWVWRLKSVIRQSPKGKKVFEVRIFDAAQAAQKQVKVENWNTLDAHPDLILFEGWFDKENYTAELQERKAA